MNEVTRDQVVDFLSNMSVIDLAGLVTDLEEKWGVSAASMAMAMPSGAGGGDAAAEEQTEFNVVMSSFGAKKIGVIKVVREITGLGLKEAKELVEGVPVNVKEGIEKEEGEAIIAKLEEAGATAELK